MRTMRTFPWMSRNGWRRGAGAIAVALALSTLFTELPADARPQFRPNRGQWGSSNAGRRVSGATRGGECLQGAISRLVALTVPNYSGVTTQGNPSLFFYLPKTQAPIDVFLSDARQQPLLKQRYQPTGKAGIVGVQFPEQSLSVGQTYAWRVIVRCDPRDRSSDKVISGTLRRVALDASLQANLANATPDRQAELYAEAGIWEDTLHVLAQIRRDRPNDTEAKASWDALIQDPQLGLDREGNSPMVKIPKLASQLVQQPLLQGTDAPQLLEVTRLKPTPSSSSIRG